MSSNLTPVTLADFLPKGFLCGDRGHCKLVCLWWHFNGIKIFAKANVNPPEKKEVKEEGEPKSGFWDVEVGYGIMKNQNFPKARLALLYFLQFRMPQAPAPFIICISGNPLKNVYKLVLSPIFITRVSFSQ